MELSSPRTKALAVTAGLSFWFFIITNSIDLFSIELMLSFVVGVLLVTQIFALKLSNVLDLFAKINTKIFLGILFVCVITIYGLLFKILRIDFLRLKKQNNSYWLNMEQNNHQIGKQY